MRKRLRVEPQRWVLPQSKKIGRRENIHGNDTGNQRIHNTKNRCKLSLYLPFLRKKITVFLWANVCAWIVVMFMPRKGPLLNPLHHHWANWRWKWKIRYRGEQLSTIWWEWEIQWKRQSWNWRCIRLYAKILLKSVPQLSRNPITNLLFLARYKWHQHLPKRWNCFPIVTIHSKSDRRWEPIRTRVVSASV